MNAPLKLVKPEPPTPAELAREAKALAEHHAKAAVAEALRTLDTAKAQLDGLADLPVKTGVLQTAATLSRAILSASNTIVTLENRT